MTWEELYRDILVAIASNMDTKLDWEYDGIANRAADLTNAAWEHLYDEGEEDET